MKINIWIMNHYATEMFEDKGGRHYNFAKYLKKSGYNPTIFCANTYHNKADKREDVGNKKYKLVKDENTQYVYVKTSLYQGNGISRIKNMFFFFKNLFYVTKRYSKEVGEKPDVILASSAHPLTSVAGILIARRYKVKCIVEIRDLWPESIVVYSEKWTRNHMLIKLLYNIEKWIYMKADDVIFTMAGGYDYICDKEWNRDILKTKVHYINNGVDIENFRNNMLQYQLQDEDLDDESIIKVVYVGSIRLVNDLGVLVDVAKMIEDKKVRILVWGRGDEEEMLRKRVMDEKIQNVIFKGHVNKQYVPYILSKADINVAHYSFANINRYGTSRNKNFEYLASGKLTISTEYDKYDFPDDSVRLSKNCKTSEDILELLNYALHLDNEIVSEMNIKAKEYIYRYDFQYLTDKLINIIEDK